MSRSKVKSNSMRSDASVPFHDSATFRISSMTMASCTCKQSMGVRAPAGGGGACLRRVWQWRWCVHGCRFFSGERPSLLFATFCGPCGNFERNLTSRDFAMQFFQLWVLHAVRHHLRKGRSMSEWVTGQAATLHIGKQLPFTWAGHEGKSCSTVITEASRFFLIASAVDKTLSKKPSTSSFRPSASSALRLGRDIAR